MITPLSHPYVPFDKTVHGIGTTIALILDRTDAHDHQTLCEIEEWLLDLPKGTWGRWADPERSFWSVVFANDVVAVHFKLRFSDDLFI